MSADCCVKRSPPTVELNVAPRVGVMISYDSETLAGFVCGAGDVGCVGMRSEAAHFTLTSG